MSKQKALGFFSAFGAKGIAENNNPHPSFSYKTSQALIDNIVAKKEKDLFSDLEDGNELITSSATQEYIDQKGKRVKLTAFQLEIVDAFAQVIDTQLTDDGIRDYIENLPYQIGYRDIIDKNGQTKKLPNSVRCVIDIPNLTKHIYDTQRVGGKQLDKVREEIQNLSDIVQVFKFKDERGGTLTIEAPIITLGKRIKYETKDGVVKLNQVEIYFEDVFVYEINRNYSLCPININHLKRQTKVRTELFSMLLLVLRRVRGNYVKHANEAVNAERKNLKKDKVSTSEEKERKLSLLKKEKLTYRESITSILERIDSKTYIDKGKYLNKTRLIRDLTQAKDALLSIGIIKEYYESTGTTGERVCNFVFDDNWLINEANKIKNLLPPSEQQIKDIGKEEIGEDVGVS